MAESKRIMMVFKNNKGEILEHDHPDVQDAGARGQIVGPPDFLTDAEYIDRLIDHVVNNGKAVMVRFGDNGDVLRPCDGVLGVDLAIGRTYPPSVYGEPCKAVYFAFKYALEDETPLFREVIRCVEPSILLSMKEAYIGGWPGFGGKVYTDDGCRYGTAAVFYKT